MAIRQIAALGALSGVFFPFAAHACTVCDSSTGQQVRAGIFNGHFIHTLGLVALPLVFLCVAIAVVYFGMPDLEAAGAEKQAGEDRAMTAPTFRPIEAEP